MALCGSSAPAPDYTSVSNASTHAADVGYQLGQEQIASGQSMYDQYMAEARRQYDQNTAISKPVTEAQVAMMNQQLAQGKDYYDYGKTFRPLEQQMLGVAGDFENQLKVDKAERDNILANAQGHANDLVGRNNSFDQMSMDDLATLTGGNSAIMAKYGADINNDVGTAVADARAGQAQSQNSAIRQAMRYGLNVPASVAPIASQGASAIAAAANGQRGASMNQYRGLVSQGIGMRNDLYKTSQAALTDAYNKDEGALNANRSQRIQDEGIKWGRGLDMAGLGRGMVGASAGAYGAASAAGSAAVSSQMQASNQLMGGMSSANAGLTNSMAQGANTTMNGQQIAMSGLNNVLNNQASVYNNSGSDLSGIGSIMGGAAKLWSISDRRLKTNIVKVADDPRGFGWYDFDYTFGGPRQRGVMADEVEKILPEAVADFGGFKAVRYDML